MDIHSSDGSEEQDKLNEHLYEPGDPDGIIAAEKQRAWQEGRPAESSTHQMHHERKRRWPVVLGVSGVFVGLLVGAYFLGFQKAKVPIAKQAEATKQKSERALAKPVTATKHYDSTTYGLSLDYPQNWIVADTDKKLTITSPNYAMQTSGDAKAGHVIVTIQNQQTSVPGYPSGGAVASRESQKLTYKAPSSVQRSETYLSFLSYGSSTSNLDVLYLTGDNAYPVGQDISMAEVARGNPLISVTFVECAKSYCSSGKVSELTLQASSWPRAEFTGQVTALLESLVFK